MRLAAVCSDVIGRCRSLNGRLFTYDRRVARICGADREQRSSFVVDPVVRQQVLIRYHLRSSQRDPDRPLVLPIAPNRTVRPASPSSAIIAGLQPTTNQESSKAADTREGSKEQ
jgi:hypothetical protein